MYIDDLPTPALVIEAGALERNLATMAGHYPGNRLRPHVKAHKCSSLAKVQQRYGHTGFTCADRKSTRLNSSHVSESRMPSSA